MVWLRALRVPLLLGAASAYQCFTDMQFGTVRQAVEKGIAVDDATLRWCTNQIPRRWPNADQRMTSIRLFKAWDPMWEDWGREFAWTNIDRYLKENNATVLIGTQITCSEVNDTRAWNWTKDLMRKLGPTHIKGLGIGNELELLQFKSEDQDHTVTPECLRRMWDEGDYWHRFQHMVAEFDAMGFSEVPVTAVFTGMGLAGDPFYEVPGKARVNSFLANVTAKYGNRFAFTFNFYPYFDPNLHLDPGTLDQCAHALRASSCWGKDCVVPGTVRMARAKMKHLTGRQGGTLWIGETGWSSPRSESLQTRMKPCEKWSARGTLEEFYEEFLGWSLDIGHGLLPPDHVFYFTMRDSVNFGEGEYFGLVDACDVPKCKLAYAGYEPIHYHPHPTLSPGSLYCGGSSIYDGVQYWEGHCKSKCSVHPECKYYMTWEESKWCRLTPACDWTVDTQTHKISIFEKEEPPPPPVVNVTKPSTTATSTTTTSSTASITTTTTPDHAAGTVFSGDTIFLEAHTMNHITVQGLEVHAKWRDMGSWQALSIEREEGPGAIKSGDAVFLRTHTGKYITVEKHPDLGAVHAEWGNRNSWERFVVEKEDSSGDPELHDGEKVYLRTHLGVDLTVQPDGLVHAYWDHHGTWQQLTVQREA